ncbi:hypothetical protein GCM10027360_65950 [Amycolatopsis echigonensis]
MSAGKTTTAAHSGPYTVFDGSTAILSPGSRSFWPLAPPLSGTDTPERPVFSLLWTVGFRFRTEKSASPGRIVRRNPARGG